MNSEQLIEQGIRLIQAGNKIKGRDLLREAVESDPGNPDAWYAYAEFCGKRDEAIYCLEQVLVLDPNYPRARETLEEISNPGRKTAAPPPAAASHTPAFIGTDEYPWLESETSFQPDETPFENIPAQPATPQKTSRKKGLGGIPRKWLLVAASAFGVLCLCALALGIYIVMNLNPGTVVAASAPTQPAAPAAPTDTPLPTPTKFVYKTPTPTPDPCTCDATGAYLTRFMERLNRMLGEMNEASAKMDKGRFTPQDAVILSQSASILYQDQRAETFPPCVDSFQKDAIKIFWNWEQATQAIENLDMNAFNAFVATALEDSSAIDVELEKLGAHSNLQSCTFTLPTPFAPNGWIPAGPLIARLP